MNKSGKHSFSFIVKGEAKGPGYWPSGTDRSILKIFPSMSCTVHCEYVSSTELTEEEKRKQIVDTMMIHGEDYNPANNKYIWDEREVEAFLKETIEPKTTEALNLFGKQVLDKIFSFEKASRVATDEFLTYIKYNHRVVKKPVYRKGFFGSLHKVDEDEEVVYDDPKRLEELKRASNKEIEKGTPKECCTLYNGGVDMSINHFEKNIDSNSFCGEIVRQAVEKKIVISVTSVEFGGVTWEKISEYIFHPSLC